MKPIIRVEKLSKCYRIGEQQASYRTLRETITDVLRAPFKMLRPDGDSTGQTFWALKDISFEVRPGEAVGIIGRNGAGKSTLLKLLSRITEPNTGRIELYGRVGSLLEVGTGFHPELTGRENIFLNGAVLGMKRDEINRKFDEIVAFAEIGQFLDTPVKHYSSGMYMRLAFAVAAHLDPEILIVDEVLAVGDAQFQTKCLAKMKDVGSEGKTILFVSHNVTAIRSLCTRGIYLKNGSIAYQNSVEHVVDKYLSDSKVQAVSVAIRARQDRQGNGKVRVVDFFVMDESRANQKVLQSGKDYVFVMEYEMRKSVTNINNVVGSIGIMDDRGEMVLLVRSSFANQNLRLTRPSGYVECHVKNLNLAQGSYSCVLFLSHGETETLDCIEYAAEISVVGGDFFGTGDPGLPSHCKVLTLSEWKAG